jgi:predicted permease
MEVINTVLPVFLIIAVGGLLRRFGFFSADFAGGFARLVYYVALPALLPMFSLSVIVAVF